MDKGHRSAGCSLHAFRRQAASLLTAQLIGAVTLYVGAAAQQTPSARQPAERFRTSTELVSVTATVTDKQGRPVTNLGRSDFTVREDGTPQQLAFFTQDEETPLSAVVLIDTSGSMVDKLENVEDAVRHLVALARTDDEFALVRFSEWTDTLVGFDRSREDLTRALGRLTARGGTALYDSVIDGLKELARGSQRKKALLLITDGNDTSSRSRQRDAVDAVTRAEAIVYALGIGHGRRGTFGHDLLGHEDIVDIRTLRTLAEPSGGRAELIEDPHRGGGVDLVDRAIGDFSRELRQQYTLAYYPTNTRRDGTFRTIEVTTTNADLKVRARKGYRAPSPAS